MVQGARCRCVGSSTPKAKSGGTRGPEKLWLVTRHGSLATALMTDRWQEIEELYHSALKHEPNGRVEFLKEACAGDEALHKEVESLLATRTKLRAS